MVTYPLMMRMHPLQLCLRILKVWVRCSMFSIYCVSTACRTAPQTSDSCLYVHPLIIQVYIAGDNRQPKRYIPFAEGPRNCVGQSLAKVSLVATLAVLLSQFSFKLADDVSFAPPIFVRSCVERLVACIICFVT